MSRISNKNAEKKIVCSCSPWKRRLWQFLCFFKKNYLELKFHYMSDFELKRKQCVGFWKKKEQSVRFDFKNLQRVIFCSEKSQHNRFWFKNFSTCLISKKLAFKKSRFVLLLHEHEIFCFIPAFLKIMTWKKNFTRQILSWKKYIASDLEKKINGNASDFDIKSYNGSDFELMKILTRQILNIRKKTH